jgi:transcription elongation GreA/GreB family factor
MSRAFVKESDAGVIEVPERPVSAHPNFVTPEGLAAIEREIDRLGAAHADAMAGGDEATISAVQRELRYWTARRASAQLIEPPSKGEMNNEVHFGSTVTVRRGDGRKQTFRIVGEDEANPSRGTLSHVAPLARALFGKTVGDTVEVAGGEAEILAIE